MSAPSFSGLSDREIDCLATVESLNQRGWPARVVDIARLLKVKPSSAIELVDRLLAKSVLVKGPGGTKPSAHGVRILSEMHRSHRIFETMLTEIGMAPAEACRESKRIDRHASRELMKAVCAYLGHPKACPDNMPIEPDPECCKQSRGKHS